MVKLSKKEINDIRGAIRTCFHRSEYYKNFILLNSRKIDRYKLDGGKHKVMLRVFTCNDCNEDSLLQKDINVDHIIPIGSFKALDEIQDFVRRVYCDYSNLQILCKDCHKIKTDRERKGKREILKDISLTQF